MQIDPNDPRYEIIVDHDGKRRKILRDGATISYPVRFMDSIQRDIAQRGYFADARSARVTAADGTSMGLHKPGYRIARENLTGDAGDAASHILNAARRETARQYALYDEQKSREYLTPSGVGEKQFGGSQVDDPCMCSNEYFSEEFASHGSMQKHPTLGLICVPLGRRVDEAQTYPTEADRAQDGIRRRREQLRDPQGREAGTEEEEEGMETQNEPGHPVNTGDVCALQQDHAAKMASLYDALDAETTNRWRTP